jgi:SRSO17 transposase
MRHKDGCKGKVRHKDLLSAQVAMKKTKNAQVQVYKCSICKHFHIGRSSNPWRKERRLDQLFRRIHADDARRAARDIRT